jgi:hypothetical protein
MAAEMNSQVARERWPHKQNYTAFVIQGFCRQHHRDLKAPDYLMPPYTGQSSPYGYLRPKFNFYQGAGCNVGERHG